AWDMYLSYISNELAKKNVEYTPNTKNATESNLQNNRYDIDKLGKFLNAKRKLKNYDFAIKEDIKGLVEFLKTNIPSDIMKFYIIEIFSEEKLWNYLVSKIQNLPDVLLLLNIINLYNAESLINKILKDKDERYLDILLSKFFSKLTREDVKNKLLEELSKELENSYISSDNEIKKEKYKSLYNVVKKHYPNYEVSSIEGGSNKSKFLKFLQNLPYLNRFFFPVLSQKGIIAAITILIMLLFLSLFLLSPFIQHKFFMVIGMKKRAALSYKKIVEKDPLNEEKRLKLAQLYEEAGMYDEALNEYNFIKTLKID
ncbi:MAG: tetratricopeptide repeat protein, partial [Fervidobacterium sp.]